MSIESFYTPAFKKRITIFITLFVLSLVVVEIWTINRLATYGVQITKIEKTKSSLQLENQLLSNKIAENSALLTIGQKTKNLGFEKVGKNVKYLSAESGLALK